MPRGYLIQDGRSPFSPRESAEFRLSQSSLNHLLRYGPSHKFFEALSIPDVLRKPSAIFQGLERDNFEAGFCYTGIPAHRYLDHNITVPPPPGFVFTIFMDKDLVIFDWRWERADSKMARHPLDFKNRFRKKLWPN